METASKYTFNISQYKEQLFKVETIDNDKVVKDMYKLLTLEFPIEKGYSLSVTYWKSIGYPINMLNLVDIKV